MRPKRPGDPNRLARLMVDLATGTSHEVEGKAPNRAKGGRNLGLEGIVTKRRDKPNRSGLTAEWVKIKNPNAPAATRIVDL